MIMYPVEWEKYMIAGKVRTFVSDVPEDIVKQAKELNDKHFKLTGKDYFYFDVQ